MKLMKEEHSKFVDDKKLVLEGLDKEIAIACDEYRVYYNDNIDNIKQAQLEQKIAEDKLLAMDNSGKDLKHALVVEGGSALHEAKIINAKQHYEDAEKYRNIITHLKMQMEELVGSLMEVEAERDMLVEQSKNYTM